MISHSCKCELTHDHMFVVEKVVRACQARWKIDLACMQYCGVEGFHFFFLGGGGGVREENRFLHCVGIQPFAVIIMNISFFHWGFY